jgi:hypothetical protein
LEVVLFAIGIILIVVYKLYLPEIKGSIGESIVAGELHRLQNQEYKVLNDVWIRTSNRSSQIDHIVISIYGIFVIETKNYKGWIHGNESSEYWTQSIYKKKTKFRNPIRQNWAHIYALKEVLSDFQQVRYHPIVVFAGSARLKNVNARIPVIYDNELFHTIIRNREVPNLSTVQVNNIVDKLNEFNIRDKEARKEHVYRIRKHVYERKQKEKLLICPRCGGNLILRKGPYGRFYGCSNYPKCRYKLRY